ncbi:MerR family transcriptional regulator [Saccharopolyspora flava]|uniref:DNA-binding transcriptional regulator, MerR family n=1 Tax=Saccharopolyspora flava TaxID=95161 RepID=A0A1I6TWQ0_9PSEU|nr:MerR family transcriptional regulator [Saccharopolyspora flava]SFS93669.1 DNA-binding transcriptional regulator, MerR family [Saccharopolyspora flava]
MPNELSIGEVAERTGLSVHALRFYERENLLLAPVRRTAGGRRAYTEQDVDWLAICTRLRDSGMPLADLRAFAALVREGPGNEEQRLALLRGHRNRVQAQLAELRSCLDLITWKVGVYEQRVAEGTATGVWDPTAGGDAAARG